MGLVPYGSQNGLNHLFNYAKNNPVNYTDPEGLKTEEQCRTERVQCLRKAESDYTGCLLVKTNSGNCPITTRTICGLVCMVDLPNYKTCYSACTSVVDLSTESTSGVKMIDCPKKYANDEKKCENDFASCLNMCEWN